MNESRASRYQRRRRRGRAAGVAAVAAALALVAFTPFGASMAAAAEAAGGAAPVWAGAAVSLVLFAVSVATLLAAAAFLGRLAGGRSLRDAARAPGGRPRSTLLTDAQTLAGGVAAFVYSAIVVQVSIGSAGRWWWLAAGLGIAAGLLLALHAAPVLIAALARARPLSSPSLAARLRALSEQAGVPLRSVEEFSTDETDDATAFVAGLGRHPRVFLASTLIQDWQEDEIAVVVAHELGHHRRGDLWRTLAVDAAVVVAGLWLASRVVSAQDLERGLTALPAVAWVAGMVWVASTPLRNAQSRHHERQADAFAIRLTGRADALSTVVRRLGARHLAEDRPSRLARWFAYRHPSVPERLAAARRADPAAPGEVGRPRGPSADRPTSD